MEITIINGIFVTVHEGLEKRMAKLEIRWRIKTIQTTALLRSARILRRVLETRDDLVTQTPVKDHQLTLVWKTHKDWNTNTNTNTNNNNIGVPWENPNRNTEPGWEIWKEGQVMKLQQTKVQRRKNNNLYIGMKRLKQNSKKVWLHNLMK